MLDHCICVWADLKLSFQATSRRKPKDLAQKLKFMQEIWVAVGQTFAGESWGSTSKKQAGPLLAKVALLALIGSWGRTSNFRYNTITSDHPDDCAFEGEITTSPCPGSSVFHDTTWRQEVRTMATLLPLSLVARSLERLNVARAIMITLKHMRVERLLSIQVDCLVFQSPRKVHRKVQEELAEMTYDRLHLATRRPLSRYVGPLQDAIASKEVVYQLKTLDQPMEHGGELTRHDGERPSVHVPAWVVHTEPADGDGFAQQIIANVLQGSSCCITGPPGTGKSHVLGQLAEALKAAGQTVQILAPTNAAARIVGGSTIHNFSTRMASSKRGYSGVILIDEISMVSLGLLAILDQLRAGDCQIVCSGDWD